MTRREKEGQGMMRMVGTFHATAVNHILAIRLCILMLKQSTMGRPSLLRNMALGGNKTRVNSRNKMMTFSRLKRYRIVIILTSLRSIF